jgi:hypothetical protein
MKNNFVQIDSTSRFPIVVVTLSEKEPTDKEFEEYLRWLGDLFTLHQDQKFIMLIDPSKSKYIDSKRRIALGNWMKKNETKLMTQVIAVSYIITNFVQRSIVKGINLIQGNVVSTEIFSDYEGALKWCESKIPIGKK